MGGNSLTDCINYPCANLCIPKFILGLRFKNRFLDLDGQGADNAIAHVFAGKFFPGKLVYPLEDPFTKGREMGAAFRGVGAVDKGKIGVGIIIGMGKGKFQSLLGAVDGRVQTLAVKFTGQQVKQSLFRVILFIAQVETEAGIEIGISPQPLVNIFRIKGKPEKELPVGKKFDQGTVFFIGLPFFLADQSAIFKNSLFILSLTEGTDDKTLGQGIDGLGTDTV